MTRYESLARIVDRLGLCKRHRRKRMCLIVATLAGLLPCALSSPACSDPAPTLQRFDFGRLEMGVEFRIRVYGCDSEAANKAATAAFDRVRELNAIMSDYDASSEVRKLCENGSDGSVIAVSADLFHVLERSVSLSRDSNGAFDVTVGPLTKLWRRARRREEMPPADLLATARNSVGSNAILLDACRRSVRLTKPDMRIDLGGIAKGYAADEALLVLRKHGFPRAMIDASGDIVVGDPPPNSLGWRVVVEKLAPTAGNGSNNGATSREPPENEMRSVLLIANQAVATSGSTVQFVEIDGRPYSHIVDPRTGLGLQSNSMVTVIAPSGIESDSLASAVSVLGAEAGVRFIETSRPQSVQASVQALTADGQVRRHDSRGFQRFLINDR